MKPLAERLWARVSTSEGCWEWQGARDERGYGRIGLGGRGDGTALVHRVSYEMANGRISADDMVLHRCDNPPCVNPDHLWVGTRADNNADMAAKGRSRNQNTGATHCQHGHEFTPENTWTSKRGFRRCRTCQRANDRKRRQAMRRQPTSP